jgi:hypothetical protein
MSSYKCTHNYPGGPDVGYISKPRKVQPETDENCHYYNHNWFDPKLYPEFWELIKEPMFTTEDGVSLFIGDYFYPLNILDFTYGSMLPHQLDELCNYNNAQKLNVKWFSTSQARENYIAKNKLKYSEQDLIYFVHEGRHYHPSVATTEVISEIIRLKK